MIYQNIKNIINKVIISIPVAHLLTENISIYSFKNHAAVLGRPQTNAGGIIALSTISADKNFSIFFKNNNKVCFTAATTAAPVESTGL